MLKNKAYNEAKVAKEKAWIRYREEKEFHGDKESFWLSLAIRNFAEAEKKFKTIANEIYK